MGVDKASSWFGSSRTSTAVKTKEDFDGRNDAKDEGWMHGIDLGWVEAGLTDTDCRGLV